MGLTVTEPSKSDRGADPAAIYPLVVLYDGVCGLCNRTVQFVLRRDRRKRFWFAPLQGEFAGELLRRHGKDPADLDTMYLVLDANGPEERLLSKAQAVLRILREIGGLWRAASWAGALPKRFLDRRYDRVAQTRYRKYGKFESCPIPTKEQRGRFIGL